MFYYYSPDDAAGTKQTWHCYGELCNSSHLVSVMMSIQSYIKTSDIGSYCYVILCCSPGGHDGWCSLCMTLCQFKMKISLSGRYALFAPCCHSSKLSVKCPVLAPGRNAPSIQFLILVLYMLFACLYRMLPHLSFILHFFLTCLLPY